MTITPAAPVSATGVINGEVITQRWIVEMILDLVGYTPDKDLAALRIVEPSAGTGAFLAAILDRLVASVHAHHPGDTAAAPAGDSICANELQAENAAGLRKMVMDQLTASGIPAGRSHELANQWVAEGDYVLSSAARRPRTADFVVGNPPYIRLEDLGHGRWRAYQQVAPTMRGRADAYVAFLEMGLRELKEGGHLGFICADRWMRNSYGRALREHITTNGFSVDAVVTVHDAPAFETEVDAYPAVTVISRGEQGHALIADTTSRFTARASRQLVAYSRQAHCDPLVTTEFTAAHLTDWHEPGAGGWPHGAPDTIAWLRDLARRWPTIEEAGARIGIGVATGADAVYITARGGQVPFDIEPDRLLPLAHADDIRSGQWRWSGRHLVNPWLPTGLVDLAEYPLLDSYLGSHSRIRERNVARRNPTKWHRTIDRVNHHLLDRRLILLQDISSAVAPVVAPRGFYPHHNLYFIDVEGSDWTPEALSGLLLSDQARAQVAAHCVLMRGGTLRLQAQYLRRVRVPQLPQLDGATVDGFEQAYHARDRALATRLLAACSD